MAVLRVVVRGEKDPQARERRVGAERAARGAPRSHVPSGTANASAAAWRPRDKAAKRAPNPG